MTSITITATVICPGGGHAHLVTSGATVKQMDVATAPFADPVTDDEALAFLKVIGKLAKVGRTPAQVASLFTAGVTITI